MTLRRPKGQVLSTVVLDGGSGPVEIEDVDIRAGGRKVDVEIKNDTDDEVTGVTIRYRCKKGTGGVRLSIEVGTRSPRSLDFVQKHVELKRKLAGVSGNTKVASAAGTIQLRCFSHGNSIIEAGYVFRGSGTVLSSGPLPDGTGWRARVAGTKAGDVVGMHIICAQPGPLLRARWQG